jgi:glycosyltransferase involved in cell wall biosynthesis
LKKLVYIVSDINKAIAFEWIVNSLDKRKISLFFIFINCEDSYLRFFVEKENIPSYSISYSVSLSIFKAIWKCIRVLKLIRPDIVHCHLFHANIIGLVAAKIVGVRKRIYTRHYSDYHHVYFPKVVKYDKFVNWIATDIIAISEVVKKTLIEKEKVNKNKIKLIHHGFDLKAFEIEDVEILENLRTNYNEENRWPVIGVVSRLTELKGIHFIIPAFKDFLKTYPNALLLIFNAQGDYENIINCLIGQLPENSYRKVKFEQNITSLYHLFDVFVHVPIYQNIEAFGQTYVEALASGVPSVFTLSGIANEFIEDEKNALVVPFKNKDAIYNALIRIITDKELCKRLIIRGKNDVLEKFQLTKMITELEGLYNE